VSGPTDLSGSDPQMVQFRTEYNPAFPRGGGSAISTTPAKPARMRTETRSVGEAEKRFQSWCTASAARMLSRCCDSAPLPKPPTAFTIEIVTLLSAVFTL